MGNRGRFGKYGETKRLNRLRSSGVRDSLHKGSRAGEKPSSQEGIHRKGRVRTRPARNDDKRFIAQLSGKVFSLYGPYGEMVAEWFASGMTTTLIALMDGLPMGFAMVGRLVREPEEQAVCELLAIAVEPDRQQMGIGRRLLKEIEKRAEQMGEAALLLHTAVANLPAQKLFSKAGYRPSGIKKKFYPAGQDALMMFKKIKDSAEHP